MTSDTFGRRLRLERERLGLTQEQLGKLGGVKRLAQYLYEQDSRSPDLKYLTQIAEAGADVLYLIVGHAAPAARHDQVAPSADQLVEIYRLVDELATDGKGKLMPLEVRLKFFQMLVSSVGTGAGAPSVEQLRKRMAQFAAG